MPGDYTRLTFEAIRDHIGVFMQQGRVLLDADFNELVEILGRRIQAGDLDTFSTCVVPRVTPDGFRIQIAGSSITIGPGRIYVDGLLAENHGADPQVFDRRLEELRGTGAVPYDEQPYLLDTPELFPLPDGGGPHLVYLDVWQRELTHAEQPALVEKAVGFDTATRLQTVWQVKVLANVGNTTCQTPGENIPGWLDATAASGGRLTTSAVGVPADDDPCVVSPSGGFRGTENRLYRVEVHNPGAIGTATFKWSRDNGAIATVVTAINVAGDQLTVARTARDDVLRFSPADWVEVLDDRLELAGLPGTMARIESVDDVAGTITLETGLPTADFDFANPGARHTRVRRWDQAGQVLDDTNAPVADVDASGGVIPINAPARFVLEHGVLVEFTLPEGEFHTGDYWVFAARTVDASVEELDAAPPRGIHHHYCRLAIVTFPSAVTDCRVLWPPEFGDRGCGCTECVTEESHNSGAFTIQMAIDRVAGTGGTVCLGPGIYNLGTTPLRIVGAQSVKLVGHGLRSLLLFASIEANAPAISISGCIGVQVESIGLLSLAIGDNGGPAMLIQNSALVEVQECGILQIGLRGGQDSAIRMAGLILQCVIRDNLLFGERGVDVRGAIAFDNNVLAPAAAVPSYVATFGLRIEDNLLSGTQRGVSMDGVVLHLGDTRIAGNTIGSGVQGGVVSNGFVAPTARLDITGNEIFAAGNGIIVGSDQTRVENNDIGSNATTPGQNVSFAGIVVEQNLFPIEIQRCHVAGNRIVDLPGDGISIRSPVDSAVIRENWIERVDGSGIVMEGKASAQLLTVADNHIVDASRFNLENVSVAGIRVMRAAQVDVTDNTIAGFGQQAVVNPSRAGIQVAQCGSIKIAGNDLQGIAPAGGFVGFGAGITVLSPFDRLDVVDNAVRRTPQPAGAVDNSQWLALHVAIPRFMVDNLGTFVVGVATAANRLSAVSRAARPHVLDTSLAPNVAATFVLVTANDVLRLAPGRQVVAARGNLLEARGVQPVAILAASGPCVFSDNRCLLTTTFIQPIVNVSAQAVIAGGNYLERQPADDRATSLNIQVSGPFTVVGNIATGHARFFVNGAVLAAPWSPLNVVVG